MDGLMPDKKAALLENVYKNCSLKRYRPRLTTNGFAALCMKGEEIRDEENDPSWGKCPLLTEEQACPIYEKRPFGCRALLSEMSCSETGYAQIPPLILTINNIFMQYIEHLDAEGFSGNFTDMIISCMDDDPGLITDIENLNPGRTTDTPRLSRVEGNSCQEGGLSHDSLQTGLKSHWNQEVSTSAGAFIKNQQAPVLMVPPEHAEAVGPLLREIAHAWKTE